MLSSDECYAILKSHFPGVTPTKKQTVGGFSVEAVIWEFTLRLSVSSSNVFMSFMHGKDMIRSNVVAPTGAATLSLIVDLEVEEFVQFCARWVTGVIYALESSFLTRS